MDEKMMELNESASYFAVIPAAVLYDKGLPPSAKLLYADISALTKAKGYCYASNEYLAQRHDVSKKTISRNIAQLAAAGYLRVDVVRNEQNAVQERRIFLPEMRFTPMDKNEDTSPQNCGDPHPKNEAYNNKAYNITPLTPHGEATEDAETLFAEFWQAYPRKTAKKDARKAFYKLKPERTLLDTMLADITRRLEHDEQWRREGGRYIPYPATWLNGRRWEDEPPDGDGEVLPSAVGSAWEPDGYDVW